MELTLIQALTWFNFREPWEQHCFNVGKLAAEIATHIPDVDPNKAFVYGLVHDYGRGSKKGKENPKCHPVEGYTIISSKGYSNEAMACITHTFPDLSNILIVPGKCRPGWRVDSNPNDFEYDEIDSFIIQKLKGYKPTIYDDLVLIADLMSTSKEYVTINQRLQIVKERYGDQPNDNVVKQAILGRLKNVETLTQIPIEELVKGLQFVYPQERV